MSPDPVAGGSATAYDYCNADPVNCTDLGGTFSFKGLLSAVAVVGEIASLIPGPVGAAAGISAVAYAVQGNTAKALERGVTAAAALVGAGAVVRVAARAVGTATKGGSKPLGPRRGSHAPPRGRAGGWRETRGGGGTGFLHQFCSKAGTVGTPETLVPGTLTQDHYCR